MDDKLVNIDTASSRLNILTQVDSSLQFVGLTFTGNKYYTIKNHSNSPSLYEISMDGKIKYIGNFTYNGEQIKLYEAIAYNRLDNKLYISVSLNGGTSDGDSYSESLLTVNTENGVCTFFCNVQTDVPNTDIDCMEIKNNLLCFYDGALPGANYTKMYAANLDDISETILQPIYQTYYFPVPDIALRNNKMYFINGDVYYIDLNDNSINTVGQSLDLNEFNNTTFRGITFISE